MTVQGVKIVAPLTYSVSLSIAMLRKQRVTLKRDLAVLGMSA
jgi:hypothetical protein